MRHFPPIDAFPIDTSPCPRLAKELGHARGRASRTRSGRKTESISDEFLQALVLVQAVSLVTRFHLWTDEDGRDVSTPVSGVGGLRFIERDHQERVGKCRTGDERCDIRLKPVVGGSKTSGKGTGRAPARTVMGVILGIWSDERECREIAGTEIGCKLRERSNIAGERGIAVTSLT